MSATAVVLLLAASISLALNLAGKYSSQRWLVYTFKPLTTVLVIAMALLPPHAEPRYRVPILIGLLLSLAGDIFLMLPRDRFVAGLASFLLAHVAYLIAFTAGVPFGKAPLPFIAYAVTGALLLTLLWAHLGRLKLPVVLYVAVILMMAAQAASRALALDSRTAILAAIGAALFVCSDAILAINRFRAPFAPAEFLIMTTYIAAQVLIAMSA